MSCESENRQHSTKWGTTYPSPPPVAVFRTLNSQFYLQHFMQKPISQQQQQYYRGNNELLMQRIHDLVIDQIAQKRWEFQHTDVNPGRLWSIANQVETLNWLSEKLNAILKQSKPVSESSVRLLIASLIKALTRIDNCLLKMKTNKHDFSEFHKLKSRATIIEWSLFQIHFVSADMLR
jgi:uncharacterized protein YbcV (DUF1398 family)